MVGPSRGRLVATTLPPKSGAKQPCCVSSVRGSTSAFGGLTGCQLCCLVPVFGSLSDVGPSSSRWRVAGSEARSCRWPTAGSWGPNRTTATCVRLPRHLAKNPGMAPPCQLATGWEDPVGHFRGARASPQSPSELLIVRISSNEPIGKRNTSASSFSPNPHSTTT